MIGRPTMLLAPLLLAALLAPNRASAEEKRHDGFSMGFTLHRFQDDFGVGATVSTPSLFESLRFTLGGGVAWYPGMIESRTWTTYGHTRLVVEGGARMKDFPLRLYGFGGFTMLFAESVGGAAVTPGGIGGFGFEFSTQTESGDGPVSYVVELGGIGIAGNERGIVFANGFSITAGLRFFP